MNKILIVGGVAGGATAAARIRRINEHAEIIVFERSGYVSYANCGLPYYIGGVIEKEHHLTLQTPGSFWDRYHIDVRVKSEVISINPDAKSVTVRELTSGREYEESYDKLLLSPGAKPIRPQIPGIDLPGIHTLRTVEDTLNIRQLVVEKKPENVTIIGGGSIGLEMAENLVEMGIDTSIVVRSQQLLPPLDSDIAHLVHKEFRNHGVHLLFGRHTSSFEKTDNGIRVKFEECEAIRTDMVILAVGVTPDSRLAKDAGLTLGSKGSIAVDDHMRTSNPDIYAVGDAVEIQHIVTGKRQVIALAGPANKEARVAANNICGIEDTYRGSIASSVIKIFDKTVATAGINEKVARASGIDYEKLVLSPANHATYYPGATNMTLKLLYEKGSLRILGSQIVGFEGVDKRSDVIATAIQTGLKATELRDLDLAYAPPYSSAKDPVNMAGFMAENIEAGLVKQFHWHDIPGLQNRSDVVLLDTRTPREYMHSSIEGFYNIPVDDLRERYEEIPAGRPVYLICQSGLRSYLACRILAQHGFDCYNFSGGFSFYKAVVLDEQMASETFHCGMEK